MYHIIPVFAKFKTLVANQDNIKTKYENRTNNTQNHSFLVFLKFVNFSKGNLTLKSLDLKSRILSIPQKGIAANFVRQKDLQEIKHAVV